MKLISNSVLPLACVLLSASLGLARQSRAPRPEAYALIGVRTSPDSEAVSTVVLRDGRIESVLAEGTELPPGCRHVDGTGLIALPGFIDAYTQAGCETPEPQAEMDRPVAVNANVRIDMRQANRKGIQPSLGVVEVLDFGEAGPEAHRESGFGVLLSAPAGQTLSGKSVLVTTRDAALRDVVVREEVFQHGAFRATGSGYPTTVMGFHAQLRQLFYDAGRHAELARRQALDPGGPRPNYDADLDAAAELLARERTLVCEADTVRDIRRWLRLAKELGLSIAISGGREAWKCAAELAAADVPVFLTLDWGEEVDDPDEADKKADKKAESGNSQERKRGSAPKGSGSEAPGSEEDEVEGKEEDEADTDEAWLYEEPIEIRRERRRLWEEGRDCALRLAEEDVRFAFCSGEEKPKELLSRVRTLVEAGLDRETALQALSGASADLVFGGQPSGFGRLEPGQSACLALWTKDPLTDKKATVAWLFVDGFAHDFKVELEDEDEDAASGEGPDPDIDLTGTWVMESDVGQGGESIVELTMASDGTLTGTIEFDMGGNEIEESVEGSVAGAEVQMKVSMTVQGTVISAKFVGEYEDEVVEGSMTVSFSGGEQKVDFVMEREPDQAGYVSDEEGN